MHYNGEKKWYAIREVSDMTGVKPVTLRAWQRRYNIVQPMRNEKGHRLYRIEDVKRILQIQRWLQQGVSIRRVKHLLCDDTNPVLTESDMEQADELLQALATLNMTKLDQILTTLCQEYPFDIVLTQTIEPVFKALSLLKSSQRTAQESALRGALICRFITIVELGKKSASRGKAFIVALDNMAHFEGWLEAARYSELGYSVMLFAGPEEFNALIAQSARENQAMVVVVSAKPLNENELAVMQQLQDDEVRVVLGRSLALIQPCS